MQCIQIPALKEVLFIMVSDFQETIRIKDLLKKYPKGLSISEISNALHMHRNTSAKYLDMLKLKGEVDRKRIGTAKNYFPVHRMPVSTLLHFSLNPVVVIDSRLEVVYVNKDALDLLGCPLDVLYGEKITELPFPLFREDLTEDRYHQTVQGMKALIHIKSPIGGKRCELRVHLIPVVFDTGKDGCAIVMLDDTGYKDAVLELERCKKLYRTLTEGQNEFIVHIRPDLTMKFVNDAFCNHTEKTAGMFTGYPFLSLFSTEEREKAKNSLNMITTADPVSSFDARTVHPDGTLRKEHWVIKGIFGEYGEQEGYHALGTDNTILDHCREQLTQYQDNLEDLIEKRVSDMKEANRSLISVIAEKEELERELIFTQFAFDNASDSILIFDEAGRICKANRTSGRLLGYDSEEILSIRVYDVNPSITRRKWENMWLESSPGKRERTVSIHRKKSGVVVKVEVSRTFLQFGDRTYFCSIAREIQPDDLTELRIG